MFLTFSDYLIYNGAVNVSLINPNLDSQVGISRLHNWTTNEDITPLNTSEINPSNPFSNGTTSNAAEKLVMKNENFIRYCVYLAKSEDDIKSLLLLSGNPLNWISLYAIYDTLKYYSANFVELITNSGYSNADIRSFTGTANNFRLLGINARHGEQGWGIPQNTINFQEAKTMILRIVKCYINQK